MVSFIFNLLDDTPPLFVDFGEFSLATSIALFLTVSSVADIISLYNRLIVVFFPNAPKT